MFPSLAFWQSTQDMNEDDRLWDYFKVLNLLTLGQIGDMKFFQYAVRGLLAVQV
jgi:hypothetical protein